MQQNRIYMYIWKVQYAINDTCKTCKYNINGKYLDKNQSKLNLWKQFAYTGWTNFYS